MKLKNKGVRFFLMGLLFFVMTGTCIAQSGAISLVQSIANHMIAGLKSHEASLKTKPAVVYELANRYVVPYADLNEMSRRVVPRNTWEKASASEKAQFKKQFTRLLVRTYASALTSYHNQTIQFFPVRGGEGGNSVVVNSKIVSPDREPINVSYRLIRSGGAWRLYDMSVEGVSMLESFRSQFSDILSQGNMQLLNDRLAHHNG